MKRKVNLKLYPIYKMFSWDLLFYYAIEFLFLTKAKGLSASQILFANAFYPIFKIGFQMVSILFIDRCGKQKSLLMGNIAISISILVLIIGNGISALFISNIFMALGFVLKQLCEPTLLDDSIPESTSKPDIFSKIDSKGSGYYYYLDAVSSIATGFLFVVNSYLPMIICFVFCLISCLFCYRFQDIHVAKPSSDTKVYFRDLKHAFKYIFKSNRLKSLILFAALLYSVLNIFGTFRSSLLVDLNVPEQYFGIIMAVSQIISAVSSKSQNWFHNKFKNKVLGLFAMTISISLMATGLFVVCGFNINILYFMTTIMIVIVSIVKGPFYTLIRRYFNSFSDPVINTKIYSAQLLVENLVRFPVFLLASFLLGIVTTSYTLVIFGGLLCLIFIWLLNYMKTRVGLKPEEYKKEDIEFYVLH